MRILLSIFLLLGFLISCSNCRPAPAPGDLTGSYIEIYDRAISYYYRHPRQPDLAVSLLQKACRGIKDHQALSCYNLGHLLELEGDRRGALTAYRAAVKLDPHPIFKGALFRLAPEPDNLETPYLQGMAKIVEACRRGDRRGALKTMRELADRRKQFQKSERLDREAFGQPFFQECLGEEAGYRELLKTIISERRRDPALLFYRERAQRHPFHSLWDMELRLRGLDSVRHSRHPLTSEWQNILRLTRRRKHQEAIGALTKFYDRLNTMQKETAAISNQKMKRQRRRKLQAIGRAAALLIKQDHYFRKLRGEAKIAGLINPWLK